MSDLKDFDLDRDRASAAGEAPPPPVEPPPEEQGSPSRGLTRLLIAAVAVAAVVVVVFWLLSRTVETPDAGGPVAGNDPPPPASESEPARAVTEPPEVEPPPPLDESDGFVRQLVRRLSTHPAMADWLASPYLVERFVAAVENIAGGTNPSSHLGAIAPEGSYQTVERNGRLEPAPANAQRYRILTQVFTGLDPDAVATAYRRLRPLLQEAYAELGDPDGSFDETLASSIRVLLRTPVLEEPPALEEHLESYAYVSPELEALAPSQKAFLRMGPENQRQIKAQLRAIADALDMDVR